MTPESDGGDYAEGAAPLDLQRRFGGVERVYGRGSLQRLASAHVCVIGLGGVGSWTVEALARSGVGGLTLIDLDNVSESNVNRQLHALTGAFGLPKVTALERRIESINPRCAVRLIEDFVSVENAAELITCEFSGVVDCIDSFKVKAAIAAHCRRSKIKLVTVGGAGGLRDPTQVQVVDLSRTEQDVLLARTRKQLRLRYGFSRNPRRRFGIPAVFSTEQPLFPDADGKMCAARAERAPVGGLHCAGGIGSVVTVTATFGLTAAAQVLNRIALGSTYPDAAELPE